MLPDGLRTLADLPRALAAEAGEAPALRFEGRTTSGAQLDERSSRVANALTDLGLAPGARVAYLARDSARIYELLFGAAKAGCVSLGVNWRLAPPELRFILEDSEAQLLVVGSEYAALAAELSDALPELRAVIVLEDADAQRGWPGFDAWRDAASARDPRREGDEDEVAVQMYTSGTTGHPKGVMLAHRSFYAVVRSMRAAGDPWIGWSAADVALSGFPSFHIGGLWWAMTALSHGACLVVLDSFDARQALRALREERVTKTCMVAAMLQMILAEPESATADFSALDSIVYGGSPIALPLLKQSLAVFGCDFAQIYGLTETGNTAVCLRPRDHDDWESERMTAAGAPYPGVRVKVIDAEGAELGPRAVGEICLHSPANMLGYWKRDEATRESLRDGWVHTGDAGFLDEAGYVYVCDRIKDMIIYAGENLYPAEIESALCEHPAVLECAVIGVPDERWGEVPKAIVALRAGAEATAAQILRQAKERIAAFKLPKSLDFVDALPRTPSGKVKKAELRAPFWAEHERQVN